jgi:hypothetical protein
VRRWVPQSTGRRCCNSSTCAWYFWLVILQKWAHTRHSLFLPLLFVHSICMYTHIIHATTQIPVCEVKSVVYCADMVSFGACFTQTHFHLRARTYKRTITGALLQHLMDGAHVLAHSLTVELGTCAHMALDAGVCLCVCMYGLMCMLCMYCGQTWQLLLKLLGTCAHMALGVRVYCVSAWMVLMCVCVVLWTDWTASFLELLGKCAHLEIIAINSSAS